MTNADRIRQMNDKELLETIYQLQGNAVACSNCFYKNGKERLEYWLNLKADDSGGTNGRMRDM